LELRKTADKYGILLIVDEVQSGMGRTGKMFAIEHFGVVPDIIAIAKGIASGLPLGATVASSRLMTWSPGSHASTFGGNPISCGAALETIRLLEEGLMQNAANMGAMLMAGLRSLSDRHLMIGDVRGLGLMIGIELVKDRHTKMGLEIEDTGTKMFQKRAFDSGLWREQSATDAAAHCESGAS
jgi:4-aminobutyrate aminotransferase